MTDLRAIAEEALPGPWEVDEPYETDKGRLRAGVIVRTEGGAFVVAQGPLLANAEHIAEWAPDRALAALGVIEAAQRVIGYLDTMAEVFPGKMPMLQNRGDRLRDALRRWDALDGPET